MRRAMWLVPFLGLSLAAGLGCQNRSGADRQQGGQAQTGTGTSGGYAGGASDRIGTGTETGGGTGTGTELERQPVSGNQGADGDDQAFGGSGQGAGGSAGAGAQADQDKMEDKSEQALEDAQRSGERVPVGGRDFSALQKKVQDSLGDDWKVSSETGRLSAMRTTPKRAGAKMHQDVQKNIRDLRKDNAGLNVTHTGSDVTLSGQVSKCDDLASAAKKFAGIDGVNRIDINAACTPSD